MGCHRARLPAGTGRARSGHVRSGPSLCQQWRRSAQRNPAWDGESVGHYEGDTLVIDTIGLNSKTYVDNYRTPHTEKLHVVERWKLKDDATLEVTFKVDDPDTFNEPWTATYRFRRIQRPMNYEEVCAENNNPLFDYHTPTANKPDF